MDAPINTTLATLERKGPLLEIRFKSRGTVNADGMREIQMERQRIFRGEAHVVMSVIPPDVEVDLDLVNNDFHVQVRPGDGVRAVALVAQGAIAEMIAKLYYAYFPPHFHLFVTSNEEEARAFVQKHLAALNAEGSGTAA